jgi:hypothetical protein
LFGLLLLLRARKELVVEEGVELGIVAAIDVGRGIIGHGGACLEDWVLVVEEE